MTPQPEKLNSMQLHLLRFFSEHQVSEQETKEIQQLIVRHFANKADARMDKIWVERNFSDQTIDEILNSPLKKST
ncbi:hypothetical protein [Spirosoma sp.]|uniref:hypothetical protein n=1 Tax=Spirosoma sp. TaxID=1899569 RepID=UPI003B3AB43A